MKFFKDTALPNLERLTSIVKNKLNNANEVMEKAKEKYGFSQAYRKAKRKGKTSQRHVKQKTCNTEDTQHGNKEEQGQEKAFTIDDDDSDNNSGPDEQDKEYKAMHLQLINI